MPGLFRYVLRMLGIFAGMLAVEFVTFLIARQWGISRYLFLPLSLGLVAFAGYDTVSRLPLIWGGVVGGLLYSLTSVFSWEIGNFVLQGRWELPAEAEPLLVLLTFALTGLIGAVLGTLAGMVARSRRRNRQRRSAVQKLAYSAFDEAVGVTPEPVATPTRPMIPVSERR